MQFGVAGVVCGMTLVVGCGAGSNHQSDAAHADSNELDSAPHYLDAPVRQRSCSGGFTQYPVAAAASSALEIVTDGTTIYFTDSTTLYAAPITGGAVATIATVASGGFELTSFGDAVFYGARLASTAYELHQRVGSVDTILGSVSSTIPIKLQANATDLYVMGSDAADSQSLWRVTRSGGAGASPPKVTTVATTMPQPSFQLGTTVAFWQAGTMVQMVAIPGPATVTSLGPIDGSLLVSGDRGYAATSKLVTSNTLMISLAEVTPVMTSVFSTDLTHASGGFLADASRLFVYVSSFASTGQGPASDDQLAEVDGPTICNFVPGNLFQDATRFYGFDDSMLDVITKPQ